MIAAPSPLPEAATALRPISDGEFRALQSLIYDEAGIFLRPHKREFLVGRLGRRLRQLGFATFQDYHRHVVGDPAERVHLLDCICTHETHFFREPGHFEFLERTVLPRRLDEARAGRRPPRIRAWSAGCSTGEEPYSIAMTLLASCPPEDGWTVEVQATDLSTRALDATRRGVWPVERAAQIPKRHLKRFLMRGVGPNEGVMKARPELARAVQAGRLNLHAERWPVSGPFDLIFCRNVLIYFDAVSKSRVLGRLLGRLAPDGFLFLGHSESLAGITREARSVLPTIYAKGPDKETTA